MASALRGNVGRVNRALSRRALRARKWLAQRRGRRTQGPRLPVFVVGCQRSGTNMLLSVLDRSPATWTYDEGIRPAFVGYRLAPPGRVDRLIRRSAAPVVAFKPVCESHRTDELLARHPRSKAVWIYRNYQDVANSATQNWGAHQRDIMRWISAGDSQQLGWRGERLLPETVELVKRFHGRGLSVAEACALFWYLRNQFFFQLELESDERVLLASYEDFVARPAELGERVFGFIGLPFRTEFVSAVFGSSVGKARFPSIDPELQQLCDSLKRALNAAYAAQS